MPAKKNKRLYIIGAGFAGRTLANESKTKAVFGEVAAFLDDDKALIGQEIDGIPVLGPVHNVAKLLRVQNSDEAVIALPGVSGDTLTELYGTLKKSGFHRIRILPSLSQIIDGTAHLIQTRSIDPQDLLGRTPVAINLKQSVAYLRGKRVLVTGAGGSIGSELCRQLLSAGVERLYLLGHGENSIYLVDRELRLLRDEGIGEKTAIVPIIGDIKDAEYIDYIFGHLQADTIFHTAAYKHVPMMEENPVAAIENNLFGTENLINAAKKNKVRRFVFITTDKAVEPVSVYGISKFLAEKLVLRTGRELARESAANGREGGGSQNSAEGAFISVRFGNVLGSRGSILPLFQKQIEKGGPLTVTDNETSRWFMTIPEACSLVLKAGGVGENGDLYLLDMGEPIRIRDMAEQMIRFYGYEPEVDIKIETIGLRPGERLKENLWAADEIPVQTKSEKILKIEKRPLENRPVGCAEPDLPNGAELDLSKVMDDLRPVCRLDKTKPQAYRNASLLRAILKEALGRG